MSAPVVESGHPLAPTSLSPAVDIVVPVHNEQTDLEPSVRRLHAYLRDEFPFSARQWAMMGGRCLTPRTIDRQLGRATASWCEAYTG